MFNSLLHMDCTTLGDCFVLSGKDGWGTRNFVRQLFTETWGRNILKRITPNEYTCAPFMYEGLVLNLHKKEGKTYPSRVLWYSGYLYRYIFGTCPDISFSEVYTKAPIQLLYKRFGFYHTQDWEYVKNDLGIYGPPGGYKLEELPYEQARFLIQRL